MEVDSYFKMFLLLGSALSFLMAIFLWVNSSSHNANRTLGVMNLFWSFIVFVFAVQSNEFFVKYPHLFKILSIIPLSLFPLLYIYIRSYLTHFKLEFKNAVVHFLPMLAYFISISPFYFQSSEIKSEIIRTGNFPHYLSTVSNLFDIVIIIQGVLYTTLSMKLIQKYFDSSVRHISKHQRYVLNWLVFFVVSYVILWALGAIGAILEILRINVPFDFFNFFYLGLTILTISIGIFALRRPSVLFKQIQSRKAESEPIKRPEAPDYSGSGNEDLQKIMDYLEKDKAYLKNDLSMRDMVDATGLSKHRISELLNKELGKNFYEILNEYRTREAIRLFNDGKHTNFTLTYIGEMAGFNSRATFNRIFKKITNQTPTEYIHSIYLDEKNKESES